MAYSPGIMLNTFLLSSEKRKALLSNFRWAELLYLEEVYPPNLAPFFVFMSIIKLEYLSHKL